MEGTSGARLTAPLRGGAAAAALVRTAPGCVAHRRTRGNLVPHTCSPLLQRTQARAPRQEVPEPIGSGQSSSAMAGEVPARASCPRRPLIRDRSTGGAQTVHRCPHSPRRGGPSAGRGVVVDPQLCWRAVVIAEVDRGPDDAQADAGAPVDGRRLGPVTACSVTGVRRDRSSPAELPGSAGTRGVRGRASSAVHGRERRRSAAPLRCGAPLFENLRGFRRGRQELARSSRLGVKRAFTLVEGAARRPVAGESSGSSGARASGRLQRSGRDILPSLPCHV